MSVNSTIRPNPDVLVQQMGEEYVLLHLRTNRFYQLNATGARFWELLSTAQDPEQIQARLLEEFDVGAGQLADEIERLVGLMQAEDLVACE